MTTASTMIPNNSRMGRILPDIPTVDVPLAADLIGAVGDLEAGRTSVAGFQARVRALLEAEDPRAAFGRWVAQAIEERQDQTLSRYSFPERDYTLQILYLAPREVHPCHCHHNVISTQVVLTGTLQGREFQRVRQREDGLLCLDLLYDGPMAPGVILQTTDGSRNAHWFAAGDEPATMLNFNIRGYESDTFYPNALRPLGRRLLDTTVGTDGPHILAAQIPPEQAYAQFGGHRLEEFPMPLAPAERDPQRLGWAAAAP